MNNQNELLATAMTMYNAAVPNNLVSENQAMQILDASTPNAFVGQKVQYVCNLYTQSGIITDEFVDGINICFEYGENVFFPHEEISKKLIFQ